MPTRMFATPLLQYHQKAMVVTSSAAFTGFGRLPKLDIRPKCRTKRIETPIAPQSMTCWNSCNKTGQIKGPPHVYKMSRVALRRNGESATAVANQITHEAKAS